MPLSKQKKKPLKPDKKGGWFDHNRDCVRNKKCMVCRCRVWRYFSTYVIRKNNFDVESFWPTHKRYKKLEEAKMAIVSTVSRGKL